MCWCYIGLHDGEQHDDDDDDDVANPEAGTTETHHLIKIVNQIFLF